MADGGPPRDLWHQPGLEAVIAPEFRAIAANGITLHAAVAGQGPLVVLVHGFPESWAAWRHQSAPIAAVGHTVCAIDCRGYGGSDKPDDIEAFIRRFYYWLAGEAPDGLGNGKPSGASLLDGLPDPWPFPAWMSEDDIAYLANEFRVNGLRGPLNRYRNQHRDVDFLDPSRGATVGQPALDIGGTRDVVLSMLPGFDMIAAMRAVDPAGSPRRGNRCAALLAADAVRMRKYHAI